MVQADPPDFAESGSFDLSSTDTYTRGIPSLAFGVAMLLVALTLGQGIFAAIQGPLRNIPVVGSLLSSGSSGGPEAWEGI